MVMEFQSGSNRIALLGTFATKLRDWLTLTLHDWIGRCGHVEWSPCSPDLSPFDFFLWGMLRDKVYSVKITDIILTQLIRDKCAKIESKIFLLHQVHENFVKHTNICIANDGKHI